MDIQIILRNRLKSELSQIMTGLAMNGISFEHHFDYHEDVNVLTIDTSGKVEFTRINQILDELMDD